MAEIHSKRAAERRAAVRRALRPKDEPVPVVEKVQKLIRRVKKKVVKPAKVETPASDSVQVSLDLD